MLPRSLWNRSWLYCWENKIWLYFWYARSNRIILGDTRFIDKILFKKNDISYKSLAFKKHWILFPEKIFPKYLFFFSSIQSSKSQNADDIVLIRNSSKNKSLRTSTNELGNSNTIFGFKIKGLNSISMGNKQNILYWKSCHKLIFHWTTLS